MKPLKELFPSASALNVACFLTQASVVSGIVALVFFLNDDLVLGGLFAFISIVFDMVDGPVARRFNLSSEFGRVFDLLNDMFSSVIVPALVCMHLGSYRWFWILGGTVYILLGHMRLTHYNTAEQRPGYFCGVPTASAYPLVVVPLCSFIYFFDISMDGPIGWLYPVYIILVSVAMVVRIPYKRQGLFNILLILATACILGLGILKSRGLF